MKKVLLLIKNFFGLNSSKKFKGFTLPELIIALSILTLSVASLSQLGTSYLSILSSYRPKFLALNIAQEGLELALALRNKQIERMESTNWLGVTTAGSYCLNFDSNTQEIQIFSSLNPCEVFPGYYNLIRYFDFENPNNSDLRGARTVKVISEVYFGREKIILNVILTKWHPMQ